MHNKPIAIQCQHKSFQVVKTREDFFACMKAIKDTASIHALDFETTSLVPNDGDVRITSIYGPAGWFVIDHKAVPFSTAHSAITDAATYVVFNIGFEGRWFDEQSYGDAKLYDVAFMPKAKLGGGFNMTLAQMALRDLKIELSKELQNSNWSAPVLTDEQYAYAASDAKVTYDLWIKWLTELSEEQWRGFLVFNDAWRATVEAEDTGLQLDVEYHVKLLHHWTLKRDVAERYVRKWAPKDVLDNLNSDKQLGVFFKEHILDEQSARDWPRTGKTQQMDMSREVLVSASSRLPYPMSRWIAALVIMRRANKYISTYGQKLIDSQERIGRVKARFNIAAAATGRYSSSAENLQNIPRSKKVRRSFVANAERPMDRAQPYRYVLADYSSIEVRVLAAISGDIALMKEAVFGDVHGTAAADSIGIDPDTFRKIRKDENHHLFAQYNALRSASKAITFSVTYGSGISSMARKMRTTETKAAEMMQNWAMRYPKAYHYRQIMFEKLMATGFIDVADGRTIYVFKSERTLPVAANYGIQGAAASVMYRAMYHVHRLLMKADIRCRIAATVHDEILLRCHKDDAEQAKGILENGMALGWLDIFPGTTTENLADASIGMSWADKK